MSCSRTQHSDASDSIGTDLDDDRYYSDDLPGVLLAIQL